MGGSSSSPPQPVQIDPRRTAEAQFKYGKKAALYNKQLAESTWQETPYGSLSYEDVYTPTEEHTPGPLGVMLSLLASGGRRGSSDVPITKMVQKLHPAEQRLLDQQRALKGQYGDVAGQLMSKAQGLFGTPIDASSLGSMPQANEATRQSQIESILSRYQPQQAQDRSRLETQLANQGFVRGSAAWDSAMDQINRRENDFRLAANLQAGGEMRADLAQQLGIRGRSFQELLLPRNQTLQELSTFMTGSQPTMPQFAPVSSPQVSAPDYAGLVASNAQMQNQANMAAYNAKMQNQGNVLGGLGSLLGAGAGFMMGGPPGASLGAGLGGGVSTFSGALPGAASGGGWSFA